MAYQPIPIGPQANTSSVPFAPSYTSTDKQASLATTGKAIKSGAGVALWYTINNTTGGAVFWQIHDGTTTPSNGAQPLFYSASIANNATLTQSIAHTVFGMPCGTGIYLVLSSTQTTYTAIASTSASYTIVYI